MKKHWILYVTLIAAGVVLGVGHGVAQEPSVTVDETTLDSQRAATPSDERAERVRSIRRNEYFYQSYGRRDLFAALVTGEFQPNQAADIVDLNSATLVGVMWGPTDRFALVEDGHGNGFILRVGDRVNNGRVVAIQENSLVATISLYGITSRVILRLEDREDER